MQRFFKKRCQPCRTPPTSTAQGYTLGLGRPSTKSHGQHPNAAMQSAGTLHFQPKTIVTTDASGEGLGATLSQIQNAQEVPIAYASHTLTAAEKNYATNEREALGVLWALEHWKSTCLAAHSRCVATISLWELSSNIPVWILLDLSMMHQPAKSRN